MTAQKNILVIIRNTKYPILVISVVSVSCLLYLLHFKNMISSINFITGHNFISDVFFINFTFLGDSIFCLCLVAYLFIKQKRELALLLLYGYLLSGLSVQVIKNLIFSAPVKLYVESGLSLSGTHGISGHTALAFTSSVLLSYYYKDKIIAMVLFLSAILLAYSRLYLTDHHLPDILYGAITGALAGVATFYLHKRGWKINPAGHHHNSNKLNKYSLNKMNTT